MLDRGLARGFEPAVEREATRRGAARQARRRRGRRDLRALPTFTIDPVSARDFDDAISAEPSTRAARVRVWVHIADVAAHVPEGSLRGPRGAQRGRPACTCRGRSSRCCRTALSSDACSLVPGVDRAAVTVELELHGAEVAPRRVLPLADPLRRAPGLRAGRPHLRRRRVRRRAVGRAAARRARRRRASCSAGASAAARSWWTPRSPSSQFDERGNVGGSCGRVQTESHRLIEHLMIAANEAVASLLSQRGVPCLYRVHERPEPGARRAARRPARLARGADAAAARAHVIHRRPPSCSGEMSQARRAARAPHRPRAPGAQLARAALAQAGLLLAQEPRPRRACAPPATATSPRPSAATPTSSATARCCPPSAPASARPRRRAGGARRVDLRTRARRDDRSSATPTTSRAASRSSGCSTAGLTTRTFAGEITGLISAGAFVAFGPADAEAAAGEREDGGARCA